MPARSHIKCVKGHGAYGGCDRCTQGGVYLRKVTFPETNAPLRTDVLFRALTDKNYHTQVSPLVSLSVNMVTGFVLDYMHLVCLGVVRKMVSLWLTGPLRTRIGRCAVRQINEKLMFLKQSMPREFHRKPRLFLNLNIGRQLNSDNCSCTLVRCAWVSDVLPPELYNNFLLLCVVMTIVLNLETDDLKMLAYEIAEVNDVEAQVWQRQKIAGWKWYYGFTVLWGSILTWHFKVQKRHQLQGHTALTDHKLRHSSNDCTIFERCGFCQAAACKCYCQDHRTFITLVFYTLRLLPQ